MRPFRREFLSFIPILLVASRARADDLDGTLASIARARAGLKSLTGPFTQERTIGLLSAKVRSTGTLTLVRPDRLRWELAPPDSIVYWITPDGLAYRSSRGEAKVSPGAGRLAAALDDLRIVLGGDLQLLRARYDLRLVSTDPELAFEATPRAGTKLPVQRIAFALAGDRITPRRVELVEGARDTTVITFGALARDTPVDMTQMRP